VRLPWKTILLQGPTIVEAARKLYAMTRQPTGEAELIEPASDDAGGLRLAVMTLERRQEEHARLLADLARQVEELTATLEMLRGRIRVALIAAVSGVAVAIVSIMLWLSR
jgi:predicted RNase H-like nuclease (RuvC/YqgF family)